MTPPLSDDAPPMATPLVVDAASGRRPGVYENSALNLVGLVGASSLGVISGLITARTLGTEAVGILAVVFGLVEFGRGLTNFTHMPSILEVHRSRDEAAVFGTSMWLKLLGAVLFVALATAAAPSLANLFHVPPLAIVLTSTLLIIGAYQEIGTARFEAANRMLARNLLVALGPAVGLLAVITYVVLGKFNVLTAITTSLLGTAAMSFGFFLVWRPARWRWDGRVARYLMTYGGKIVITSFLTQVLLWTDTLMISAILGNEQTGIYNVVFQLTFVMVTASIAIGVALLPAMSELASRAEGTADTYHRGTLLSLAVALCVTLGYAVAGRWILGLYGPAFVVGYIPLMILTVFAVSAALAVPAQSMMTVHGRATTLMIVSLAMAAVNIPLNWFLIHRWGILGASIATTSVFAVGLLGLWALVHRSAGALPLSRSVVREGWILLGAKLRRR